MKKHHLLPALLLVLTIAFSSMLAYYYKWDFFLTLFYLAFFAVASLLIFSVSWMLILNRYIWHNQNFVSISKVFHLTTEVGARIKANTMAFAILGLISLGVCFHEGKLPRIQNVSSNAHLLHYDPSNRSWQISEGGNYYISKPWDYYHSVLDPEKIYYKEAFYALSNNGVGYFVRYEFKPTEFADVEKIRTALDSKQLNVFKPRPFLDRAEIDNQVIHELISNCKLSEGEYGLCREAEKRFKVVAGFQGVKVWSRYPERR